MAIRSARGTKDVLPAETPHWRFLEDLARDLAEDYGYREIRTPMFENSDLFLQGMGASAGLVERELWTFHDKHGRKLALRADMTAPTMRAYHEHGLGQAADGPSKLYYLGSVFLHGREREVESRQVHQFGVEALGSKDPALDAEVVVMAADFCVSAGLPDVKVQLNSLGCKKCRPAYHQALKDYFGGRQDELCKTCKRRYRSHPLWTLGCDAESCLDLSRVAPSIYGHLCSDCRTHFSAVKAYLKELKVDYQLNPLVVRDLEYYDRTIFQVTCVGRAVAFGGRYDELSVVLGGPQTPAVGCSIDLEPLLDAMHEAGLEVPAPEQTRVCLAGEGEEAVTLLLPILYALRRAGVRAELAYPMKADETPLQVAERSKAPLVVILEEEDARRRLVTLVEADRDRRQQVRLEEAISRIGRELGLEGLKDELRPVEVRHLSITRRRRPVRGRGRAMYGTDVPRLSRTSSRTETEDEGGRRRRRRRTRAEEAAEAAEAAGAAGGSAEERSRKGRKRRRSRRGAEGAEGGEAERRPAESGTEATASRREDGRSRREPAERGRRGRRHRHESEDSLEAAAAPSTPTEEGARSEEPSREGRERRRRRSGRPEGREAEQAPTEPRGAEDRGGEGDSAEEAGGRRRRRRRSRRGGRGGRREEGGQAEGGRSEEEPRQEREPLEESAPAEGRGLREPREGRRSRQPREPREERPAREDREPRDERPAREEREPRDERPAREEREPRDERPAREEREPRDERPAPEEPAAREQRAPRAKRPSRAARPVREALPAGGEAPAEGAAEAEPRPKARRAAAGTTRTRRTRAAAEGAEAPAPEAPAGGEEAAADKPRTRRRRAVPAGEEGAAAPRQEEP